MQLLIGQMNLNECVYYEPNKHTMKFQLKQASPGYLRQLKSAIFFGPNSFLEWSERLSAKTACDVNVGQVKEREKFKAEFFESTWRRNYGGLCGPKPGKNRQFAFKSCKLWL